MGMLVDFYCGDTKRIVNAWRRNDTATLEDPAVVTGHADLSFHLSPDDLEALVLAACELAGRPPISFSACLKGDAPPEAESGIHELSEALRDLLAAIPAEQVGALYDRWSERRPKEAPAVQRSWWTRLADRFTNWLLAIVFMVILIPIEGALWLFSRDFREKRRRSKAARAVHEAAPPQGQEAAAGAYTLRDAMASLVETCGTARATGRAVLYAWSL